MVQYNDLLAPLNIYVNAILPGPIRTHFYDHMIGAKGEEEKDAFFDGLGKRSVPLQRVGTPEDIAGAALFLASEHSAYITGSSSPNELGEDPYLI